MNIGVLLLICVGGLVLAFGGGLQATGSGSNWRWLRWPLAFGILVISLLALTTTSWPDGLGVQSCSEVVNPALATDASQPQVIVTCEPIPATGATSLFTIALFLLLLSPELTEFGVPGLLSLKKRVTETEEETDRLSTRISQVQASISTARVDSRINNVINLTMEAASRGQKTELYPVVSEAAALGIKSLLQHGEERVPVQSEFVYYRHVGGGLLRQYRYDEPHVTDFQSGNGATGQAWRDLKTIVVTGEAVHNADYGLSVEQQEFFADLTIVGATPIYGLEGRTTLGVLAASSKQGFEAAEVEPLVSAYESALETTARLLAVTLVAYDLEGAHSR